MFSLNVTLYACNQCLCAIVADCSDVTSKTSAISVCTAETFLRYYNIDSLFPACRPTHKNAIPVDNLLATFLALSTSLFYAMSIDLLTNKLID